MRIIRDGILQATAVDNESLETFGTKLLLFFVRLCLSCRIFQNNIFFDPEESASIFVFPLPLVH